MGSGEEVQRDAVSVSGISGPAECCRGMQRYVLPAVAILVSAATIVASGPTEDAAGRTSTCRERGATVQLENRWVTVLSSRDAGALDIVACYKQDVPSVSRRATELIAARFDEYGFLPPALALSSRTVAFGIDALPPEGEGNERYTDVFVLRFFRESEGGRHAGWYTLHSARAGLTEESKIGSIVVRPNGAVAWISCPMQGEPNNSSAPTCVRTGYNNAVFRTRSKDLEQGSGNRELLDRGRGIDPRSLRRTGDRIYWTKNGRRRSAVLN